MQQHQDYSQFLNHKATVDVPTGLPYVPDLNPMLFEHQADMVRWALRRGRAALFADCGLGKTPMQLEWANHQPHDCIIVAPLAVAHQFGREAQKFGVDVAYAKDQSQITKRITVTNYERLENFNIEQFGAVSLDECSILKSHTGAYASWIIDAFKNTPFRLCCSATPAPNDVMELGTQAEFLGVMSRSEMLAMYFTHDGGDTSKWRVKGHAQKAFWSWMATWAVMIRKPSDLGYSDDGFVLPPLRMYEHCVSVHAPSSGFLFAVEAQTLQERQAARRETIDVRSEVCYKLIYENERTAEEVQQDLLRKERGENASARSGLVGGEQGQCRQGAEEGISARVLPGAPREVPENSRTAESVQREAQKGLCGLSRNSGEGDGSVDSLAKTESDKAQGATAEAVRDHCRSNDGDDGEAGERVCHMRGNEHQQQEPFSCCGPLPCYGGIQGNSLREVQQGDRSLNGQSKTSHGGSKVPREQWIVFCNLNSEQDKLRSYFGDDCVSIYGSLSMEEKEARILRWLNQEVPILLSKPSITGYGLNLQQCRNMAFVGLSDSYEQLYQSIRRCYRFGQVNPVNVHVITAETEGAVVSNIKRKDREAEETYNSMIEHMKDLNAAALQGGSVRNKTTYNPTVPMVIPVFMKVAA